MKIVLASIHTRDPDAHCAELVNIYLQRLQPYVSIENRAFRSEASLLETTRRSKARTAPVLVLLDPCGKTFSSEDLAAWVGRQRDAGVQNLLFAIGSADGWSPAAREQAALLLSFGPMIFPHELARVMLAEQLYRAFTILAGHPYHAGH
jgi:23S rRNA (pseudouridine1915-N3)-methyltransferase